jgi:hypothetical protein
MGYSTGEFTRHKLSQVLMQHSQVSMLSAEIGVGGGFVDSDPWSHHRRILCRVAGCVFLR